MKNRMERGKIYESYIEKLGRQAKEAAKKVLLLETEVKNNILREVAKELRLKKKRSRKKMR